MPPKTMNATNPKKRKKAKAAPAPPPPPAPPVPLLQTASERDYHADPAQYRNPDGSLPHWAHVYDGDNCTPECMAKATTYGTGKVFGCIFNAKTKSERIIAKNYGGSLLKNEIIPAYYSPYYGNKPVTFTNPGAVKVAKEKTQTRRVAPKSKSPTPSVDVEPLSLGEPAGDNDDAEAAAAAEAANIAASVLDENEAEALAEKQEADKLIAMKSLQKFDPRRPNNTMYCGMCLNTTKGESIRFAVLLRGQCTVLHKVENDDHFSDAVYEEELKEITHNINTGNYYQFKSVSLTALLFLAFWCHYDYAI
jgi:hypothetical protein